MIKENILHAYIQTKETDHTQIIREVQRGVMELCMKYDQWQEVKGRKSWPMFEKLRRATHKKQYFQKTTNDSGSTKP